MAFMQGPVQTSILKNDQSKADADVAFPWSLPLPLEAAQAQLPSAPQGKGRTPLARAVATMMSRYHGGVGEFRSASDFGFFSGMKGSRTCPNIYDDGDICEQSIKKMKAFSDVGDEETMTKERWTAAKWIQGQMRIVCDNRYDPAGEPKDSGPFGSSESITHESFIDIVKPAFPTGTSKANFGAILRRSAFIINSKDWLTWRLPGEDDSTVHRYRLVGKKDLLNDDAKPKLKALARASQQPESLFHAGEASSPHNTSRCSHTSQCREDGGENAQDK